MRGLGLLIACGGLILGLIAIKSPDMDMERRFFSVGGGIVAICAGYALIRGSRER